MAFVSATAAASAFANLLTSIPSAARAGAGLCACPQPGRAILAPLLAAKGSNSEPVVLEGKVKGKKKKGSGAGNLSGALDVEIREAQEYLDSDEQVIPSCFPTIAAESFGSGRTAWYIWR
jgi:complement component 1 Q subcomponent-binding protein